MSDYYIAVPHDDYIVHHGVLGQKCVDSTH